jgi:hypothetical protein
MDEQRRQKKSRKTREPSSSDNGTESTDKRDSSENSTNEAEFVSTRDDVSHDDPDLFVDTVKLADKPSRSSSTSGNNDVLHAALPGAAVESGWRKYTTGRGWATLLREEWCYVLGFLIGFVVVLVLGLVPLQLNQVQQYQVATTWFTTFRINAVAVAPSSAVLNVTTSTFTKLLPTFNVTSSQVKINHVNLQLPASASSNMTTIAGSNSTTISSNATAAAATTTTTKTTTTTTTTTATAAPATQATVLVKTNSTGNSSAPVTPPVAPSGPLYSIQADIALNGTRNFTSDEFTAAWIVALNTTKGAFGSNVTLSNWTITTQPPPAPKLPTLLYTPWKVWCARVLSCTAVT